MTVKIPQTAPERLRGLEIRMEIQISLTLEFMPNDDELTYLLLVNNQIGDALGTPAANRYLAINGVKYDEANQSK